jgi:hypothetical protein
MDHTPSIRQRRIAQLIVVLLVGGYAITSLWAMGQGMARGHNLSAGPGRGQPYGIARRQAGFAAPVQLGYEVGSMSCRHNTPGDGLGRAGDRVADAVRDIGGLVRCGPPDDGRPDEQGRRYYPVPDTDLYMRMTPEAAREAEEEYREGRAREREVVRAFEQSLPRPAGTSPGLGSPASGGYPPQAPPDLQGTADAIGQAAGPMVDSGAHAASAAAQQAGAAVEATAQAAGDVGQQVGSALGGLLGAGK